MAKWADGREQKKTMNQIKNDCKCLNSVILVKVVCTTYVVHTHIGKYPFLWENVDFFIKNIYIRYLLSFFDCLAHPNQSATFVIDHNDPEAIFVSLTKV